MSQQLSDAGSASVEHTDDELRQVFQQMEDARANVSQNLLPHVSEPAEVTPNQAQELISAWFQRAAASCCQDQVPSDWKSVVASLVQCGATSVNDFTGVDAEEAAVLWFPLRDLPSEFRD